MEEQQETQVKENKKYNYPNKKHIVVNAEMRGLLKAESKKRGLSYAQLIEEMWQLYLKKQSEV